MIATLPMYDRPETEEANDRFWALIRENLPGAPEHLSRDGFHWLDPDLILSQTCSLPYRTGLQDAVMIVATPVHDLPCPAGCYFSVIVVREDDEREDFGDFTGARLAINNPVSQSGWAAIDDLAQAENVTFGAITNTGSHQASAEAVAEARADICAIDAVTWTHIQRFDPFADRLRIISSTQPTPALPYITAFGQDVRGLQEALVLAVDALSPEDQELLCLIDITHISADRYIMMPIPPTPALSA